MPTMTETYTEYEIRAIEDFRKNFNTLMGCCTDYARARKAEKANNEKYGYTQQYGAEGYVQYSDRDPGWKAVDNLVHDVFENHTDTYSEAEAQVTQALSLLPSCQREQIVGLVEAYLSELDSGV